MAKSKVDIAAELCKRFPDAPARTLAKKLHTENPALFTSIENARTAIRTALGINGKRLKKLARLPRAKRPAGHIPPLPESQAETWVPLELNSKRTLSLGDIHLPFHDKGALEAALQYGVKFKPDTILLNGDLFDLYAISRFDKDPTKPKVKDELICGRQFLGHLRHRFPKAEIVFRYGNHDRRWDLYLMRTAPDILDIEGVLDCWHKEAGIIENGVRVVRGQLPIMLGKLPVFHGDELPRGMASPVNPARGAFLRTLSNLLHSHLHRTSEHTERTMDGRIITCRTTGCLCGLSPEYARINKWDHGFATIEVASDGNYECELKRIIEGRVY